MSAKGTPTPKWYKNTYFWIGAILLYVALFGLFRGEDSIRDPGQKRETGLVVMYLVAAGVSLLNGYFSHQKTVRDFNEDSNRPAPPKTENS